MNWGANRCRPTCRTCTGINSLITLTGESHPYPSIILKVFPCSICDNITNIFMGFRVNNVYGI